MKMSKLLQVEIFKRIFWYLICTCIIYLSKKHEDIPDPPKDGHDYSGVES